MALPRSAACSPLIHTRCMRTAIARSIATPTPACTPPVLCPHIFRRLEYAASRRHISSKRKIQTATAYHPSSLDLPPLATPPRNFGVPDTSIAGDQQFEGKGTSSSLNSAVHHPDVSGPQTLRSRDPRSSRAPVSLREEEAQKSAQPVQTPRTSLGNGDEHAPDTSSSTAAAAGPSTSTSPTARPRRFAFRPLKAALTLTPAAVTQMRALSAAPTPKLIRVGVRNKGCSGLAYHLEYVDGPGANDETVAQDGARVVIDSKALWTLIGSEMDWVEDKLAQRFVFRNPNIKEQCGCGESFMV